MKKNFKMMVKKVVEVACIAGITLAVNGVIDGINDTQIQPVANAQEVNRQLISEDIQPVGTMIAKDNWLNENDDENKDLDGNVVIDDGKKVIEISEETYEEVEHGENSDLDGDVYIDEEDIVTNELYHQVKSTEDFRNSFSGFNVVDSKNDGDKYRLTLSNGLELIYLVDYDMFYVYNIDGNIKEFECMNDTKDYLSTVVNDTVNTDDTNNNDTTIDTDDTTIDMGDDTIDTDNDIVVDTDDTEVECSDNDEYVEEHIQDTDSVDYNVNDGE